MKSSYERISAWDKKSGTLNVIIDTPKGSRNKFKYDMKLGMFKLGNVLPAGMSFPYDFGYIPSTVGGDGDPLDVLLLMDEPTFPGCLVPARLIGVIKAEQTDTDGRTMRNDRLIAVATDSRHHKGVRSLKEISTSLIEEIEHFFISYNEMKEKQFIPKGRFGPKSARRIVEESIPSAQPSAKKGSTNRKEASKK